MSEFGLSLIFLFPFSSILGFVVVVFLLLLFVFCFVFVFVFFGGGVVCLFGGFCLFVWGFFLGGGVVVVAAVFGYLSALFLYLAHSSVYLLEAFSQSGRSPTLSARPLNHHDLSINLSAFIVPDVVYRGGIRDLARPRQSLTYHTNLCQRCTQ